MAQLRVLLGFTQASDHELEETAGQVRLGIYDHGATVYPDPPVAPPILAGALTNFTAAIAAQKSGGAQATAYKDEMRAALLVPLRQLALYVQQVVQDNPAYGLAELLLSGFDAVSTNRAQHPLAVPPIERIDNTGAGRLTLRIKAVPNARLYEARYKVGAGEWVSAGLFTNSRKVEATGLTAGTTYTFEVRAVGGSTGASPWSDPVSHMSL